LVWEIGEEDCRVEGDVDGTDVSEGMEPHSFALSLFIESVVIHFDASNNRGTTCDLNFMKRVARFPAYKTMMGWAVVMLPTRASLKG